MTCKTLAIFLFLLFFPLTGMADEGTFVNPEEREFHADYRKVETDPEAGEGIRKYAEDPQEGLQKDFGVQFVHDNEIFAIFNGDRLEYQTREGKPVFLWDIQAWVGTDFNKLWFKSEGEWLTKEDEFEEASAELLYSRNIGSFWDVQIGVRHDFKPDPERTFAALGIQGLAPLWFEVEATTYLSEDADLSVVLEAEYDLLLSQRLILQPRLEISAALQEVEEYGVGQGLNDIELGLRLRYEIQREFAPYIGVSWNRKIGETENLAEAEGEDIETFSFVVGLKTWF
jgi:copper resistance protein B